MPSLHHFLSLFCFKLGWLWCSLFLFGSNLVVVNAQVDVGQRVCLEGFVMDRFCIDRTTLLDNPSVRTLIGPERHSVHCLVDVGSCVRSPFEILFDPLEGEEMYARGAVLNDSSKEKSIDMARAAGRCSTCDGTGSLRNGFRVGLQATITRLGTSSEPPQIDVQVMEPILERNLYNQYCTQIIDMQNQQQNEQINDGETDPNTMIVMDSITLVDFRTAGSTPLAINDLNQKYRMHGSFMLISWGFLLPTGAVIAKFFKHRPNGLWFQIHRACQTLGLLLALIGWLIALRNFNVFMDKGLVSYKHGIMGMTTMILGLLQPLNAVVRPHPPSDGEEKTTTRLIWEIIHKGLGWSVLILAMATIIFGTRSLPLLEDKITFQRAYGFGAIGCILLVLIAILIDKATYEPPPQQDDGNDDDNNKKQKQKHRDYDDEEARNLKH